jgi:hypothetical protein
MLRSILSASESHPAGLKPWVCRQQLIQIPDSFRRARQYQFGVLSFPGETQAHKTALLERAGSLPTVSHQKKSVPWAQKELQAIAVYIPFSQLIAFRVVAERQSTDPRQEMYLLGRRCRADLRVPRWNPNAHALIFSRPWPNLMVLHILCSLEWQNMQEPTAIFPQPVQHFNKHS